MRTISENYIRNAKVIRVTDGDTVVRLIDMGFTVHIEQPLRLNRINSPELRTVEGKTAKAFLVEKLPLGASVIVQTYKNPSDKYGRWIADLYYNGVSINDLMVENGHAVYQSY